MPAVSRETPFRLTRLNRSQLLLQRLYVRSHEDKRDVRLFPPVRMGNSLKWVHRLQNTRGFRIRMSFRQEIKFESLPEAILLWMISGQNRMVMGEADDLADRSSRLLELRMPNRISWILYEPCLNFQFLYSSIFIS